MARVKTFVNNGSLLPGDLNSIQDDYEKAFSAWRDVISFARLLLPATVTGAGVYRLDGDSTGIFRSDPAWYASAPRTGRFRLVCLAAVNATAPGVTFTAGVYPVTAVAGGSGALTATLGTPTHTTSVPVAASTLNVAESTEAALSPGSFALAVSASGAMAAASAVLLRARLQVRAV